MTMKKKKLPIGIENFESSDDVLMHLLHSYRDVMSVL